MVDKKEVIEVKSISKETKVCQNCRTHSNNPSYCRKHREYTGRKGTCEDFK